MAVREMTEHDSRELLARGHVAHLGCVRDQRPYVVPVHYAFDAKKLYVFSLAGQKIDWLRGNPNACIQVEETAENGPWKSVVVQGSYLEFPDTAEWHNERLYAWSLLQKRPLWWEPGSFKPDIGKPGIDKPDTGPVEAEAPIFFGISIDRISGRESVAS